MPYNVGSGYSANSVNSQQALPYDQPYGAGGGGGGGGYGGYDLQPATSGGAGGDAGGGGSSGGGMGAAGWAALFQMIGDKVQGRVAAADKYTQARLAIPGPEYANTLQDMVRNTRAEGMALRDSKLGPRATSAARTAGARAADQRGLQGPLAAAVSTESENQAASNYDQWKLQALQMYRQNYLALVREYLSALQQRKGAMQAAQVANRDRMFSMIPMGPIGTGITEAGINSGLHPASNEYSGDAIANLGNYKADYGGF